jgi:hypothetical protein
LEQDKWRQLDLTVLRKANTLGLHGLAVATRTLKHAAALPVVVRLHAFNTEFVHAAPAGDGVEAADFIAH